MRRAKKTIRVTVSALLAVALLGAAACDLFIQERPARALCEDFCDCMAEYWDASGMELNVDDCYDICTPDVDGDLSCRSAIESMVECMSGDCTDPDCNAEGDDAWDSCPFSSDLEVVE